MTDLRPVPFEPFHDILLVQELPRGLTPGGLAVPETADLDPPKGRVVKAGPGKRSEFDGTLIPMQTVAGDVVYLGGPFMKGIKINLAGTEYVLIRDRDTLGKVP